MDSFGPAYANTLMNGDALYNYVNGVPQNISAYDTPTYSKPYLDHDMGIYAMDTWTYKRISVTAGIRWDYLDNHINAEAAPAGRFVPARSFAPVNCTSNPGISCFKDWAPRVGVVYDLFGDHKTAIKAGVGKYDTPLVSGNLNAFNPMFVTSETVTWVNAPTTACQVTPGLTLNTMTAGNPNCIPLGSGFGVGNLGPNPNLAFGTLPVNRTLDPNYHREYNWQESIGIQREVYKGVTANFNWNHRSDYQQVTVINYAVPSSAWTPQTITNPLDGSSMTIFNLNAAYSGLTPALHQTNAPQSLRQNVYNGLELSANARLPRRITLFGGWSFDKMWDRTCDQPTTSTNYNDPNTLRYCDMSGQSNLTVNGINVQSLGAITGVPYRNEFKLSGNIPIKWGIEAAVSLYSAPVSSTNYTNMLGNYLGQVRAPGVFTGAVQGFYTVNWSVGPTTKYPTDCDCSTPGQLVDPNLKQGTEVIQLVAPGSRLTPRIEQFDVTLRRVFHIKEKYTLQGEFTMFNLMNQSVAITEGESLGTNNAHLFMTSSECSAAGNPTNCGIGGAPSVITNPRMFRLSAQFKF